MADIICRACKGRFHETTDKFTPDTPVNGSMLTLKQPYKGNGWTSFPEHAGTSYGEMECPECGAPYTDDRGRVLLDGEVKAPKVPAKTPGTDPGPEILALHAAGKKPAEIWAELKVHPNTVKNALRKAGIAV